MAKKKTDPARAAIVRDLVASARPREFSEEENGIRTTYRRRRYFFPVPRAAGAVVLPPVDVLDVRRSRKQQVRSKTYPYHNMGEGWVAFESYRIHPNGERERLPTDNMSMLPRPSMKYVDGSGRERKSLGELLDGHYSEEVPCDERCVFARGNKCECSCGGSNHGAGLAVKWVTHSDAKIRAALEKLGLLPS